jgi:alpha-beta hydrolase superfamily lysophospholipase
MTYQQERFRNYGRTAPAPQPVALSRKRNVMAETRLAKPQAAPLRESQHTMMTWDGVELFYRAWRPPHSTERAIILFHRGHEHSGRWHDVVKKLDLSGFSYFAWDARGHGRSSGERGYAEDFGCLVRDVDGFVRHVSETYDIAYENIVVLAHSVGSVLVSTWIHDYAPPIRALVLGSPALRVRLYVPFAVTGLRFLQKIRGKAFISSYVKGRLLTRDPEKKNSYDDDPLV